MCTNAVNVGCGTYQAGEKKVEKLKEYIKIKIMANYKETPIETGEDLTGFAELDEDAYPIWTCTNRLRWKNIGSELIGEHKTVRYQLQQLWECSTGNTEWRKIEIVD